MKCIDCDYVFSCDKQDENKKECKYYIKANRTITKLERKKGNIFEFKEIEIDI